MSREHSYKVTLALTVNLMEGNTMMIQAVRVGGRPRYVNEGGLSLLTAGTKGWETPPRLYSFEEKSKTYHGGHRWDPGLGRTRTMLTERQGRVDFGQKIRSLGERPAAATIW